MVNHQLALRLKFAGGDQRRRIENDCQHRASPQSPCDPSVPSSYHPLEPETASATMPLATLALTASQSVALGIEYMQSLLLTRLSFLLTLDLLLPTDYYRSIWG